MARKYLLRWVLNSPLVPMRITNLKSIYLFNPLSDCSCMWPYTSLDLTFCIKLTFWVVSTHAAHMHIRLQESIYTMLRQEF